MKTSDVLDLSNVAVIIPAKDEQKFIGDLISQLLELGLTNIILVNDNSSDKTREIAEKYNTVTILDHVINLGAGAATQTGIAYAARSHTEIITTIDADLQHNPKDLLRLITHLRANNCDLVIGSRFLKNNNIPKKRVLYNKVGNVINLALTGKYLTDSQSGLKAMTLRLASHINLNYDGFEFCMEIVKQANSSGFKIQEIPIDVTYSADTMKKGQNLASGLRMVSRILSPFS